MLYGREINIHFSLPKQKQGQNTLNDEENTGFFIFIILNGFLFFKQEQYLQCFVFEEDYIMMKLDEYFHNMEIFSKFVFIKKNKNLNFRKNKQFFLPSFDKDSR